MRTRSACCLEEETKEHSFSQNSLGFFPQPKLARDFTVYLSFVNT